MATRTRTTPMTHELQCRYTVPQHICREECYWITQPIDEEMTSRIVLITPRIALQWLKRNDVNRTFSRANARVLTSEMSRGFWKANGESIVFDTDGVLIDGQHRLQAVLSAGHEYLAPVITGVLAEARPTVDTGMKRSTANNFQMAGESNAGTLAATIILWKGYQARIVKEMTHPELRLSVSGAMDYLKEWPGLREAATAARKLRPAATGRMLVPTSEVAMVWFAIVSSGASKSRANEFMGSVLSGFDLSPGNPILALRRRLSDHMRTGHRMHKRERLALLLKTWQLWSTGQTRKVIRWEFDQDFPFLD